MASEMRMPHIFDLVIKFITILTAFAMWLSSLSQYQLPLQMRISSDVMCCLFVRSGWHYYSIPRPPVLDNIPPLMVFGVWWASGQVVYGASCCLCVVNNGGFPSFDIL